MQGQIIKIDINEKSANDRIYAKQYDVGRKVNFFITENGSPLNLIGYTIQFQLKKPDGTKVINNCSITDPTTGKASYVLSEQATSISGFNIPYQLQLYKNSIVVTTLTGFLRVDPSVIQNEDLESSDDFSALQELINGSGLDLKMDKLNPVCYGSSFSFNRKSETPIGNYSFAEGYQSTASGYYSHSEGNGTTASGGCSHAEGSLTYASGACSHAEGSVTIASGSYSHAEGGIVAGDELNPFIENLRYTQALGVCSHAEGGSTYAEGSASHAEGIGTYAQAKASHAEGYKTKASGEGSHAEGLRTSATHPSSHAEGTETIASYNGAHAEGQGTMASQVASHAEGRGSIASFDYAHAEGWDTTANGEASHSEGYKTTASGYRSHAEGKSTTASGNNSHAEGDATKATGGSSHSEGYATTSSGNNSHAEGKQTVASKNSTHAEGFGTIADVDYTHAQGQFNVSMASSGNKFSIGNGIDKDTRSNAFSVTLEGIVKAASTITASTTADYAEYFEWLDGNTNNEDRVGHFVTLDGDKIRFATSNDDYVLGIVSGAPCVLGNGDCDVWNGMYLRDNFRRYIYEPNPKLIEILDEEGNPTGELKESEDEFDGMRPKLNPLYDRTQTYKPRAERPEWSPVGMLGVLSVYHDGTATINGYVTVNDQGIATTCDIQTKNSYRVIKDRGDNIIEVIFR